MAAAMKCMCVLLVVLALVAMAPDGEGSVGCGTVVSYLNGCIPYVTGRGPLGGCCGGVYGLFSAARTTADRQAMCGCLKVLHRPTLHISAGPPRSLASVRIPCKISPSTDCSKVT